MKIKQISFFVFAGILSTTSIAFAKGETAGQGQQATANAVMSASPSANMVGNKNEVQTQNKGEESMLQVNTAEKENLGTLVSQKVQELLDDETLEKGIGQQVKLFVQEQKQTQDKIQMDLDTASNRVGLLKSLIGPDYKALKNAKTQLELNQMRIKNLEELKLQLTNQSDMTMVTETIQALVDQNTALQNQVELEESSSSLLGWLFKLFAK
jgi:hypothetical protein